MKELNTFRQFITENENEDKAKIVVNFNQPFTVTFDALDFESDEEFADFVNKLKSDESFAFDTFFDNIDLSDSVDRMDQNKWTIDRK